MLTLVADYSRLIEEGYFKNLTPSSGIWLHGNIEDMAGHDNFYIVSGGPLIEKPIQKVLVALTENKSAVCVLIMWRTIATERYSSRIRGLVVSIDDKKAIHYALKCKMQRCDFL